MQRIQYDRDAAGMAVMNHKQHNDNPDYWDILLEPMKTQSNWQGLTSLDFGCGHGRNIENMYKLHPTLNRIDGCDISQKNIDYAKQYLTRVGLKDFNLFVVNGVELDTIPSDLYNFVMSTIVFQHICVYSIRFNLMKEIFRVMRTGAIFSFQMGFGEGHTHACDYFRDYWDAPGTNSCFDVKILDPELPVNDLKKIGFVDVSYQIRPPWEDRHEKWIYLKAQKP